MLAKMFRFLPCLLILVVIVAVGCSEENALVGKWQLADNSTDFFGDGEFVEALEFFEEDTVILTSYGRNFSGTYDVPQDDQIQMTISGDLGPITFLLTDLSITSNKISFFLNGEGNLIELVRVNE